MYDFLLTVHVVAAVIWAGGGAVLHVIGRRAIASGDPARVLQFVRDAGWVGPRLFAPLSLVLIVAGFLLVEEVGASYGDLWITIGMTTWLVAFAIGAGYYARPVARVEQAVAAGGDDAVVIKNARAMVTVNTVELAMLFIAIVAMTTKPGL